MNGRLCRMLPFLLLAAYSAAAAAAGGAQQPPTDPERFHVFLLAGQSNMAGRGEVAAEDRVAHPRVWMLDREGRWVPATDPMHFDRPTAAVGPGRSFGIALAENDPTLHIGLIPAAVGGSALSAWTLGGIHDPTGAYPYDEAIARTRAGLAHGGVLKGILWHQGESDSNSQAAPAYGDRLRALVERFRIDLGDPTLPVLVGQLGQFEGRPWDGSRVQVDAAHRALPWQLPNVGYVSAEGLQDMGDALHFSAPAARELGRRYAAAYRAYFARPPIGIRD